MNTLNEYVVEELQERLDNDLTVYKTNSDASLGLSISDITDFKYNVHQRYIDMIVKELNAISPNLDKDIINKISNYNFNKFDLYINKIEEEHIKSLNFKYLVHYCRLIEKLLNDVIKNKIDNRAMFEILEETSVYKVEKQSVVGNVRYGKDLSSLKNSLEYTKVKVTNDYFDGTIMPFVSSFKSKQNEYNRLTNEYTKIISIISGFMDRLVKVLEENKENPYPNSTTVHKICIKAIRNVDKLTGFITFCVLLKIQEFITKVISVQSLYTDLLNTNVIVSEGFNGNIIFPTDTHSLAENMLNGKCSAFIDLTNQIYGYYTLHNNLDYQLTYNDNYSEPDRDKGKNYDNSPYVDVANAIGIISRGLDRLGKEGDQYLMMFDDVLKETGLNIPLKQRYKNELEMLANGVEKELPILDVDNIDRKLWELISFKKNIEALTNLVHETYRKIELLLERFGANINAEYKDVDTINQYKIFLTDFISVYRDFIENICGALITRLNNLNDSLEKSTETLQPNYVKPEVTDSQLTAESFNFMDIVYKETVQSIEDEFRYNFICLENEYVIRKHLQDTGYQLVIEKDEGTNTGSTGTNGTTTGGTTTTTTSGTNSGSNQPSTNTTDNKNNTNSSNNTQNNQNQNNTNGNQNDQNKDNTKVQVNDNNGNGKSSTNVTGLIKKIIDKIITAFKNIAMKMAQKNDKWIQEHKNALLNRSYANVTVNILPYHNIPIQSFTDDPKKLTTNLNSITNQTLASLNSEQDLYGKLFTFINGGINIQDGGTLSDAITKYYKVGGSAKLEVVEIANGDLKSKINGDMIPYCEKYPHDFLNSLTTTMNQLKESADNQVQKITSADSDNSLGDKPKWLVTAIGTYCGALCNAARDRYTDYFKVLYSLLPKTTSQNDNNQNNNQINNNNNQNNQPQQNNNNNNPPQNNNTGDNGNNQNNNQPTQ